jgi:hypothetical protein
MPDATPLPPPPRDWQAAFGALPSEAPPEAGWTRICDRLNARRPQHHGPAWFAAAAALLLAVALPWQLQRTPDGVLPPIETETAAIASENQDPLQRLYAESGQLESLLQLARDDRVASGTAAAMASELDARIASIDAALMQPDLPRLRQLQLWQDRVDALRSAAGFEGTRRWLAAQGTRYDAALVRID